MLTADIGSHVDTFLELVADDDDECTIDVVDIRGGFDSVVIGHVCLHPTDSPLSLTLTPSQITNGPVYPERTHTPHYSMSSNDRTDDDRILRNPCKPVLDFAPAAS